MNEMLYLLSHDKRISYEYKVDQFLRAWDTRESSTLRSSHAQKLDGQL